jgi:predicted MFS family arabinose efflux permease
MIEGGLNRSPWAAFGVLCAIAVVSDLSYAGLTPLLVAYGDTLHFDLPTSGWLATAEGIGFAAGAFLAALFSKVLLPTRFRISVLLMVLAIAQLLSASTSHAGPLGAWRALSGTMNGLIYAGGMASIARGEDSERGFSLYFGAIFVSGLIGLGVIPRLLRLNGLHGFYLAYAVLIVACIGLVRWYPQMDGTRPHQETDAVIPPADNRAKRSRYWMLLASLFINFVFNGGLWVLAERFGLDIHGTDVESLSALLAGSMLFALLGTVFSTIFVHRWSKFTTIIVGNAGLIAAVMIMSEWHTIAGLVVAMAFLNMSVTFLTPAMLSALANRNAQGAQWGNLASQAGYSVGPAIAATIATQAGMNILVAASVVGFVASAVFAWLGFASIPAGRRSMRLQE